MTRSWELRFNSDLDVEITWDIAQDHLGPGAQLLRTWGGITWDRCVDSESLRVDSVGLHVDSVSPCVTPCGLRGTPCGLRVTPRHSGHSMRTASFPVELRVDSVGLSLQVKNPRYHVEITKKG